VLPWFSRLHSILGFDSCVAVPLILWALMWSHVAYPLKCAGRRPEAAFWETFTGCRHSRQTVGSNLSPLMRFNGLSFEIAAPGMIIAATARTSSLAISRAQL
jgi:hypothetical protein